ncbi:hypothetical protein V6B97_15425 [Nitratidesulfovibrio sp. 1201_IL3209]
MFGQWRGQDGIPTLVLAGPDEFSPDAGEDAAGRLAPMTRRAYDLLRVDDGYLSAAAAAWFRDHADGAPAGFREVGDEPATRLHHVGGRTVAVVFLPAPPKPWEDPTPAMAAQAVRAGQAALERADLVIAVAGWGGMGERRYLAELGQAFHILLGGGIGTGFDGVVDGAAPSLLWSRPDMQGRSVNVVDVLAWPQRVQGRSQPRHWIVGMDISVRQVPLKDAVEPDPVVEAVVGTVPAAR